MNRRRDACREDVVAVAVVVRGPGQGDLVAMADRTTGVMCVCYAFRSSLEHEVVRFLRDRINV